MSELLEQIKVVVEARRAAGGLKDKRDASLDEWNKTNRGLLDALTQAGAEVAEVETQLRELTLKAYEDTGSKAPAPGVGIREMTKLRYDSKIAFDWAKSHKLALKLDKEAFGKIAKASPPDFVEIITEAIATISPNLEVEK